MTRRKNLNPDENLFPDLKNTIDHGIEIVFQYVLIIDSLRTVNGESAQKLAKIHEIKAEGCLQHLVKILLVVAFRVTYFI
jgi:hypothetical protein